MKKMILTFCLSIICLFISNNNAWEVSNASSITDPTTYKTLDELKKELQEERKKIEDEKLEQLKLKEMEKAKEKQESGNLENKVEDNNVKKVEPSNSNDQIPKLIVRLRGKHSSKYLCSYSFEFNDVEPPKTLSKNLIDDYSTLLKKPSLKVRANEIINFEFSETPESIRVFRWDEDETNFKTKRGSIRVPDLEEKIVVGIEGNYKNGIIRYAVILDIRK